MSVQTKMDKRANSGLQNITQKTRDRGTRTLLKTGGELRCSGQVGGSFITCGSRRDTLVTTVISN